MTVDEHPATGEVALDAMYGYVHRRGDVHDYTLAVVRSPSGSRWPRDLPARADIIERRPRVRSSA
jgi:hypothetical protein